SLAAVPDARERPACPSSRWSVSAPVAIKIDLRSHQVTLRRVVNGIPRTPIQMREVLRGRRVGELAVVSIVAIRKPAQHLCDCRHVSRLWEAAFGNVPYVRTSSLDGQQRVLVGFNVVTPDEKLGDGVVVIHPVWLAIVY